MSQFIDRRLNGKNKSAVNRQRFIRRYKNQIKKAVSDSASNRSITDIDKCEKITISNNDISEPIFHHGSGGCKETILPGNEEFVTGDKIPRPSSGSGQGEGSEASNAGEGEDSFVFELSREEFLDLYFEDLALPDLIKKEITKVTDEKFIRSGLATTGVPNNINIIRTMRQAIGRRNALRIPYRIQLSEAEQALSQLLDLPEDDPKQRTELEDIIASMKNKIQRVPFLDTIDLRYNRRIKQEAPSSQAVMFCLMDVSGSMDEMKKNIAKRFFYFIVSIS